MNWADLQEWVFGWLWRSSVVALPAALVIVAAGAAPARLRHRVSAGVLVVLLVFPALFAFVPRLSLGVLPDGWLSPGVLGGGVAGAALVGAVVSLWAAGAIAASVGLVRSVVRLGRLCGRARDWRGWEPAGFGVPVRVSEEIGRPMVAGLWSPVVLLPVAAGGWSRERLRFVLLHEQAHVVRGDLRMRWLGHLARVLYWFHPAVRWLAAQHVEAGEFATDEVVVDRLGGDGRRYALELLDIASEGGANARGAATAAAAVPAGASALERRVRAIVDRERERGSGEGPQRRVRARLAASAMGLAGTLALVGGCEVAGSGPGPWTGEEVRLRLAADPFPGR